MSEAFGVEDDGTPRAVLDIAGQAVRAFNHRTGTRFTTYRNGWNHAPDVYRCLGELTYLTGGLRQVIEHMRAALHAQLDAGELDADPGSEYDGRPEQAIAATRAALDAAEQAAATLYGGFDAAQNALSRIHYAGPDLDGDD